MCIIHRVLVTDEEDNNPLSYLLRNNISSKYPSISFRDAFCIRWVTPFLPAILQAEDRIVQTIPSVSSFFQEQILLETKKGIRIAFEKVTPFVLIHQNVVVLLHRQNVVLRVPQVVLQFLVVALYVNDIDERSKRNRFFAVRKELSTAFPLEAKRAARKERR